MKKNTILSIMTCAAMLLFMAACSNDENNNGQEKPIQAVQFSFTNEDFGADEALSRATGAAEAKPQTVDLGDCEAEISVENEPAVKTRGTLTNADGHYTIRAYQGSTLKGEMKGTFSGGNFTPDASSSKKLNLPYGTYDFIAFNDLVSISGTELKVDRTDAETARMGFTTVNINSDAPLQVLFTMKHVGCRLRTQFVCQKHIPNAVTATLEQTAANVIPTSVAYNPTTKAYTSTNGTMTTENNNSPASTEEIYTASNYGQNYAYTSTSTDYHYFLPTTDASKLKLTFTAGTLFWKPLTGGIIPRLSTALPAMQANKSYRVIIKLKPNYTYLMSDGTTGHFKDTTFGGGTKTPIALVLDKDNHMGIALKRTSGGAKMKWCTNTNGYYSKQTNVHMVTNLDDALNSQATSGYEETWNTNYSTSNVIGEKVKGKNADFLAFKAAADYNSDVVYTGSPTLRWYLPSYSDWKWLYSLGFGDKATVTQASKNYEWYGNLANSAFTQVGGILLQNSSFCWSSSETSGGACSVWPLHNELQMYSAGKTEHCRVYSFVKY